MQAFCYLLGISFSGFKIPYERIQYHKHLLLFLFRELGYFLNPVNSRVVEFRDAHDA
jgi:hypothetical protein